MARKFSLFVNGVEVTGKGGVFEDFPAISVIVKGDIDPGKVYELLHNGTGHELKLVGGDTLNATISATGQAGYHSFQLRENGVEVFPFPFEVMTTAGEMMLADFWAMVGHVFSKVISLDGSFAYLDGTGRRHVIRNALFSYNWLESRIDLVEKSVNAIVRSGPPMKKRVTRKSPSPGKLDLKGTRKLIMKRPGLMSEHPGGFELASGEYLPDLVLTVRTAHDPKIQEVLQAYDLVRGMYDNVRLLLELFHSQEASSNGESPFDREIETCLGWSRRLLKLRRTSLLAGLDTRDLSAIQRHPRTPLQMVNPHFANLYDIYLEYLGKGLGVSGKAMDGVHAHMRNLKEIYQTYCAHVVAETFGMEPVGESPSERDEAGRSFVGESGALYYETLPEEGLRSWTSSAGVPDILLFMAGQDKLVPMITSYSSEDGKSSRTDRLTANAMMNAYNLDTTVILYPGDSFGIAEYDFTHGMNFKILEVPIKPTRIRRESDAYMALVKGLVELSVTLRSKEEYLHAIPGFEEMRAEADRINKG